MSSSDQDVKVEDLVISEDGKDLRIEDKKEEEKEEIEEDENEETKEEHPVFAAIKALKTGENELDAIRNYFEIEGIPVDIEDGSGMTPLMHASWKGHVELAKYLIKQGANLNAANHEHGYTTLHFAALAGSVPICKLLLAAGVKVDETNSVKRTAAQMAAFVGQHQVVSVINNFVPKEEVYYFTMKQPFEDEPKLPLFLAKPIYDLVMSMNTHPVAVALVLKAHPELLENIKKVTQILELMSEKQFKNRRDVNEVLALKFHMLYYILKDIQKQYEKDLKSGVEHKTPFLDRWIKSMLVGRESDGYPVFQESFLRQGVKEFPFPDSQLFKMLVTNFSHCNEYGRGSATAAEYINQSFNGQKGFKDNESCETCGEEIAPKKCSNCKSVQYCNQQCQKLHWFIHKKTCARLKERYEKMAAAAEKEQEKNKANKEKSEEEGKIEEDKEQSEKIRENEDDDESKKQDKIEGEIDYKSAEATPSS